MFKRSKLWRAPEVARVARVHRETMRCAAALFILLAWVAAIAATAEWANAIAWMLPVFLALTMAGALAGLFLSLATIWKAAELARALGWAESMIILTIVGGLLIPLLVPIVVVLDRFARSWLLMRGVRVGLMGASRWELERLAGVCQNCGYDLRGSGKSGCCPECGQHPAN